MSKVQLYQKLLKIQKEIKGLGVDKKSFGYSYTSGAKMLSHIKPLMNQYGLLLKQEVTSIENVRQDYNTKNSSKSEILTKVMMRFTWIDTETGETDVNEFGANGQNDWEKGLGSALTYAERYFLLKYFHISTDEDDIDNPERKKEEKKVTPPSTPKQPSQPVKKKRIPDLDKIKGFLDNNKTKAKALKQLREQFELTEVEVSTLGLTKEESKGISIVK